MGEDAHADRELPATTTAAEVSGGCHDVRHGRLSVQRCGKGAARADALPAAEERRPRAHALDRGPRGGAGDPDFAPAKPIEDPDPASRRPCGDRPGRLLVSNAERVVRGQAPKEPLLVSSPRDVVHRPRMDVHEASLDCWCFASMEESGSAMTSG
jgi:hypothetical protein